MKAPATSGQQAITRYVYDNRGNLIRRIDPNQYDATLDNPQSLMSMSGELYAYDALNRRVRTYSANGELLEVLAYNGKDQVIKQVDGLRFNGDISTSAGTSYVYDGLGRLIQRTDALCHQTTYTYDILGHATSVRDANGNVTAYQLRSERQSAEDDSS